MPALPPRLSLEQVRRLAKDLLRDLKDGDRAAIWIGAVGGLLVSGYLASQLAWEYGGRVAPALGVLVACLSVGLAMFDARHRDKPAVPE